MSAEYGHLVSAKDALMLSDDRLPIPHTDEPAEITQAGNALWSYKFENRINGVKVVPGDTGLLIDREDLLFAAFQYVSVPKSVMLWMSPDIPDSIKAYDELLARAADRDIIIAEESSQYDPNKGAYLVWIKYNEISYALHKRFNYLREESK